MAAMDTVGVHALLESEGWRVSHGRVMRVWRREGLKVPAKQPKRGRLWLNDGSCMRLRPAHRNHVWSWDFVFIRTDDGRAVKLMVVIDEFTRACLAIYLARRVRARDALEVFADLMQRHGIPHYSRSDNGPEMVATVLRRGLKRLGTETIYITPGSPWENGVELHLKLTQVLHLKVTHLEEPEYGSSVLGFSSFCLLGFLRRAVFEAVAIVAGFNDVAVMSQPVE